MNDVSQKPAAAAQAQAKQKPLRGPAGPARMRMRHKLLFASFFACVLAPLIVAGFYLYTIAEDQYASHLGFSVRTEEVGSAIELLGGITELSGSSSSDTDILYEFIQSQRMVRLMNDRLDLVKIYHKESDPVFGLGDDTRIEALAKYWNRMVKVFYDSASGLIEVRVLSFDPEDSRAIAIALFEESSRMINDLSAIARADAMGYADEELIRSVERLKEVRQARTAFRNRTQIVDPAIDIQGRMVLLNSLQAQWAEASIALQELLVQDISREDSRIVTARRRIDAINTLMEQERSKIGTSTQTVDGTEEAYSDLLAEYEVLQVELEFAEKSYLSSQAARDVSFAEAQRKSRYLAMHVEPELAETAEYPRRGILMGLLAVLAFISWSILAMIYYSLRDRR
ncbi:sugar transporter [Sulfitobacter sp.]|uniref:sugar transporter n=1 Tax=Sulfitobacter sp. TaxID=1903071 RepID=UPI00300335FD